MRNKDKNEIMVKSAKTRMIRRPGASSSPDMVKADALQMVRKAPASKMASTAIASRAISSPGQMVSARACPTCGKGRGVGMPTGKRGRGRRRKAKRMQRRMQGFNRMHI